jgi:hypothetical protein
MSDYRDPNDPYTRNMMGYEPYSANSKSGWAWIAAAVFLVIVLAIAFGAGREPNRVASNDTNPAATQTAPPAPATSPAAPAQPTTPSLVPPPGPAPAPAPNRP